MSNPDDKWRDGYDAWKLESPYDDEPDECDHLDYSVSWDGRAECGHCPHSWWLSEAQQAAYDRMVAEHQHYYDRLYRWENGLLMRVWRWLQSLARPRSTQPELDDEIPF